MKITFTIPGHPVAKARPRVIVKGGRTWGYTPESSEQYMALLRTLASDEMCCHTSERRIPLLESPLKLTCKFYFRRPKGHFGTGKNGGKLKDRYINARPTGNPEISNLVKAIEDGCNGIVYRDDSQIVEYGAGSGKYYVDDKHPAEGAEVTVELA